MTIDELWTKCLPSLFAAGMIALGAGTLQADDTKTEARNPGPALDIIKPITPKLEEELKKIANIPAVKRMQEIRKKNQKERYYPVYHYTNKGTNAIHDPNGLCRKEGVYHMFYQARPQWGHAYSRDLVHWKDMPIAIHPSDGSGACYSGSVLVEEDRAIAFYPGRNFGMRAAIATDPLLMKWEQVSKRPLSTPMGNKPHYMADSCIWKENDGYYGIITGMKQLEEFPNAPARTAPFLFRSKDLKNWEFVGNLLPENEKLTEYRDDPSCPYFLPIGKDKHILITFSHTRGPQYLLGDYDHKTHVFTPYRRCRFNRAEGAAHGFPHAPSAMSDGKGGVFLVHNMSPGLGGLNYSDQLMTITSHLTLDNRNRVRIQPVDTIKSLRKDGSHVRVENQLLKANQEFVFGKIRGDAMEISAVIQPSREHGAVRLLTLRSADKREYVAMTYHRDTGIRGRDLFDGKKFGGYWSDHFVLDTSRASLHPKAWVRPPEVTDLDLDQNELLRLRIFVDKRVIEVFVNEQRWMALSVYPTLQDSLGFSIEALGTDAKVVSLDAWQMNDIYSSSE